MRWHLTPGAFNSFCSQYRSVTIWPTTSLLVSFFSFLFFLMPPQSTFTTRLIIPLDKLMGNEKISIAKCKCSQPASSGPEWKSVCAHVAALTAYLRTGCVKGNRMGALDGISQREWGKTSSLMFPFYAKSALAVVSNNVIYIYKSGGRQPWPLKEPFGPPQQTTHWEPWNHFLHLK